MANENQNTTLKDGLRFEDDTEGIIFNQYSFCELVKHIIVKYTDKSSNEADELVRKSFLMKLPESLFQAELLSHELEFHWAMLITYGDLYWTKGIPSDFNNFRAAYLKWETGIKVKYHLKEAFDFYDLMLDKTSKSIR